MTKVRRSIEYVRHNWDRYGELMVSLRSLNTDVAAPATDVEGGLFSETNDNSVGLLLTYGSSRVLLAGGAEARSEEYMANGPYAGSLTGSTSQNYKPPELRFRAC